MPSSALLLPLVREPLPRCKKTRASAGPRRRLPGLPRSGQDKLANDLGIPGVGYNLWSTGGESCRIGGDFFSDECVREDDGSLGLRYDPNFSADHPELSADGQVFAASGPVFLDTGVIFSVTNAFLPTTDAKMGRQSAFLPPTD